MCLVEWKIRDGIVPKPTFLTTKDVKFKFPEVLIDYYESNIKFPRTYEVTKKSMALK